MSATELETGAPGPTAETPAPAPAAPHYPCLDAARAIAATGVVVTHVAFWTDDYTGGNIGRLYARLDVGVAVFFVLSGFLLSRPMFLAARTGRQQPSRLSYLWRRGLRVLPAYWVTVFVALLFLPINEGQSFTTWWEHLALLQIYTGNGVAEGLTHTWSLCTEVAFYVALPFLVAALLRLSRDGSWRPGRLLGGIAVLSVAGLAYLAWVWATSPDDGTAGTWLPSYLAWFGVGMAFAVLTVCEPDWWPVRAAHELGSSLWTCWAAAAGVLWIAFSPLAGPILLVAPTPFQAVTKNVLYTVVATLFVLPLVFGDQRAGRTRAVLSSAPLQFLGRISYGLFLLHLPALVGIYAVLDMPLFSGSFYGVLLLTWVLGVLFGWLSYQLVEAPAQRWRNLFATPRPADTGTTRDADGVLPGSADAASTHVSPTDPPTTQPLPDDAPAGAPADSPAGARRRAAGGVAVATAPVPGTSPVAAVTAEEAAADSTPAPTAASGGDAAAPRTGSTAAAGRSAGKRVRGRRTSRPRTATTGEDTEDSTPPTA
ncbi:acyltransferase family protein [Modestobacter sp. I12A-02628]|uniref:Acyltransferase family protein n=1 Tax=Goekera deserti TaxID=2497753 RepID=A0A7K3WCP0_9ACTN|nr:acyltransferase [Goekera deserti]MPQ97018.1 acyltransferase family protein [Goekera deserti]NDI46666.1 acyltransferase family protein [Goekera deserti]NEL54235.1 acyltransferase family protein [Goekera deserti]